MADDLNKDSNNSEGFSFEEYRRQLDELKSILSDPNYSVHILEQEIPLEVQKEYFVFSEKMKKDRSFEDVEEEDFDFMKKLVADPEEDLYKRKFYLCVLSMQHKVPLFRFLQSLVGDERMEAVKDWLSMVVLDCQMAIEKELSGKQQVLVSCAMGGKDKKIRFYALMMAREDKPFEEYQKKVIENEVLDGLKAMNVDVEMFRIREQVVEIQMLVPFDMIDVGRFERLVEECNVYGNFLDKNVIITNMGVFTEEMIQNKLSKRKI